MIKFHNTLSGKLEEFKPIKEGEVSLYTCGPTVYDFAHIGNFRTFVFEDLLRRFLEYKGYKVNHVMNVTDVDDKTIAGAQKEKKSLEEFTKKYTDAFNEDLKTLNCLASTKQPHATHEIPAMVELIKKLIANGAAYEKDGSVYYRVASFPNYGKLSKKDLKGNIKGARVDVDEYDKEEGSDFALWKKAKDGEPAWDSPWGKGRPGWHIECSMMSMKYLGDTFDIHAGGEDLIFPHHENEIAQSEAATKKQFVKYWLHSKHLLVNGEKMSKSKGNYYTLRDLLKKGYDPMAIRYALLSVHYRQQLNFTLEGIQAAKEALLRIQHFLRDLDHEFKQVTAQTDIKTYVAQAKVQVEAAMENDLNVPAALGAIFEMIKKSNITKQITQQEKEDIKTFFRSMDRIFGVFSFKQEVPKEIQKLVEARDEAKKKKDFNKADEIREEIKSHGYIVTDSSGGVTVVTPEK